MPSISMTYVITREALVTELHECGVPVSNIVPVPATWRWGSAPSALPSPEMTRVHVPTFTTLIADALATARAGAPAAARTARNQVTLLRRQVLPLLQFDPDSCAEALRSDLVEATRARLAQIPHLTQRQRWDLAGSVRWWARQLAARYPSVSSPPLRETDERRRHRRLRSTLRQALSESGLTQRALAERARIPIATLEGWLAGRTPNVRTLPSLGRAEAALGLQPGALTSLVTHRVPWMTTKRQTEYGDYLRRCRADRYQLAASDYTPELRAQFLAYVLNQTGAFPLLPRAQAAGWRMRACSNAGERGAWYAVLEGQYCPTAEVTWRRIASFLSWLASIGIGSGPGPLGVSAVQTLAWLVVPAAVEGYVRWHMSRAGAFNSGGRTFCQIVHALVAPKTGWLRLQPQLAGELPARWRPTDWEATCERVRVYVQSLSGPGGGARGRAHAASTTLQRTRDPFDALQFYLEQPDPARPLLDAIEQLLIEVDTTAPGSRLGAIRLRDAAILAFLLLVPVRLSTGARLTVVGPRPHVRVDGDSMHVAIPAALLKNGRTLGSYEHRLQSELCRVIERYVQQARPLLCPDPAAPYLFVATRGGSEPWLQLSMRVVEITRRLCRGHAIPSHSLRHLVGTRHMRLHPGDYAGAATILHDTLQTTITAYAPRDPTGALNRNGASLRLCQPVARDDA